MADARNDLIAELIELASAIDTPGGTRDFAIELYGIARKCGLRTSKDLPEARSFIDNPTTIDRATEAECSEIARRLAQTSGSSGQNLDALRRTTNQIIWHIQGRH